MNVTSLDHLVLTVWNIEETYVFYRDVLGMQLVTFGDSRKALHFGTQKINLHEAEKEIDPKAARPTPGSADLCFLVDTPLSDVMDHLRSHRVPILLGPVSRTGAQGPIESIYIRDPNANLIELSVPQ